MLNRLLDILVSLLGLLVLLLMLPVVALLIKWDSPGPVFYAGWRVGKDRKLFRMFKFRTMYETLLPLGVSVSPQGDPRVTPVGLLLRRLKLNEFPQFYNVLKGDMTLVGPRPEAPDMAEKYPPEAQKIFSVKPGLVGPNQILGRNEEEMYPRGVDPTKFYLEEILPKKLPIDLEYIETKSFLKNLKYLFMGTWVTITGAISRQHLTDNVSQIVMLVADTVGCLASFTLAHLIRFEGFPTVAIKETFFHILPLTVITRIPLIFYLGGYQTLFRFFTLKDLKKVFQGVLLGSLLLVLLSYFTGALFTGYGRSVFITDWLCLTVLLLGYRVVLKTLHQRFMKEEYNGEPKRVALIWGSGEQGLWCLRYLTQSRNPRYEVIGFIDDEIRLHHKRIDGLRVLGDHHHLVFASTWGINGVASVSALAIITVNILMAWTVWRKLQVRAFAQRILWANLGGIGGVTLFYLAQPWLGSLVGGVIFAATYTLFVLKTLKHEISMLREHPQWLGA